MKQNVDLTRDRDFRDVIPFLGDVIPFYTSADRKFVQSIDAKRTFPTGDSNIREFKRYESGFCEFNGVCDCCGTSNPLKLLGDALCIDCKKVVFGYGGPPIWWRLNSNKQEE